MARVRGGCLAVTSAGAFCCHGAPCGFTASKLTYTHPDNMTATNCYEAAVDADLYVALHLMQGWNIQ